MKANLFIVGAPKCGTTALATWLSSHPEVFVSPTKEPHYFSTEFQLTKPLSAYEDLFAQATPEHKWRCEASVWYMYSPVAVRNALEYSPDAKVIAMVRNPVDLVPSAHRQQRYNAIELVEDLDRALDLNDARLAGKAEGIASGYPPDHVAYFHACALGWQIKRLIETVPPAQLHIVVYDDLKANPRLMYEKVLSFLGVSHVLPEEFAEINTAKVRRSWWVDRLARNLGEWKTRSGIRIQFGILSGLRKWNQTKQPVERLSADTRRRLIAAFAEDQQVLQNCIGRDLSHWSR